MLEQASDVDIIAHHPGDDQRDVEGETIVGYTDLPLRLAFILSTHSGTNIAKFILPQTTKEKGMYQINLEDDTIHNMLDVRSYPDMITPFSSLPPKTLLKGAIALVALMDKEMCVKADDKQCTAFVKNAAVESVVACTFLAFGYANDLGNGEVSMLTAFALAGLAEYQAMWGWRQQCIRFGDGPCWGYAIASPGKRQLHLDRT